MESRVEWIGEGKVEIEGGVEIMIKHDVHSANDVYCFQSNELIHDLVNHLSTKLRGDWLGALQLIYD